MKNISIITDIETGQRTVRFQGDWTPEEKLKGLAGKSYSPHKGTR